MATYRIQRFSSQEDEEKRNNYKKAAIGAGLIGAATYGGNKLGYHLDKKAALGINDNRVSSEEFNEIIKRIGSPDIAISDGKSLGYDKVGPNAISRDRFKDKFSPERLEQLKKGNVKSVVELGGEDYKNCYISASHEFGHAHHQAGRGSSLGRLAHNSSLFNRGATLGGLALMGGAAIHSLTSDKDTRGTDSAIAATGGLMTVAPELIREHTANQESLRLLKDKAKIDSKFLDITKNTYKNQLAGRAFIRASIPVGLGVGAAYLAGTLKKKKNGNKEEKR